MITENNDLGEGYNLCWKEGKKEEKSDTFSLKWFLQCYIIRLKKYS